MSDEPCLSLHMHDYHVRSRIHRLMTRIQIQLSTYKCLHMVWVYKLQLVPELLKSSMQLPGGQHLVSVV